MAGDDTDEARLADSDGRLCELMHPCDMSADLEFMPWTALPDARSALQIVDKARRPCTAGILIDPLRVGRCRTSLEGIRALLGALLRALLH